MGGWCGSYITVLGFSFNGYLSIPPDLIQLPFFSPFDFSNPLFLFVKLSKFGQSFAFFPLCFSFLEHQKKLTEESEHTEEPDIVIYCYFCVLTSLSVNFQCWKLLPIWLCFVPIPTKQTPTQPHTLSSWTSSQQQHHLSCLTTGSLFINSLYQTVKTMSFLRFFVSFPIFMFRFHDLLYYS